MYVYMYIYTRIARECLVVSEAHPGCHGYHYRCVLCEEWAEAEERVDHRANRPYFFKKRTTYIISILQQKQEVSSVLHKTNASRGMISPVYIGHS
jgi:hypothetical protein